MFTRRRTQEDRARCLDAEQRRLDEPMQRD
jgi:hypothetical protein